MGTCKYIAGQGEPRWILQQQQARTTATSRRGDIIAGIHVCREQLLRLQEAGKQRKAKEEKARKARV
jgi:hypothetical protein